MRVEYNHPAPGPVGAGAIPQLDALPPVNWETAGRRWAAHPAGRAALEDAGYRPEDWVQAFKDRFGYWLPEELETVFTRSECVQLDSDFCMTSFYGDYMEDTHGPARFLIFKAQSALYRIGFHRSYESQRQALLGIKRLLETPAGPGFELRLTWTPYFQAYSWSAHGVALGRELYLDAPFGLLLYYRGEHVLTVGFSPTKNGVAIAQVQLRNKQGNRWLYRIPGGTHYLDWVLEWFAGAWEGMAHLHLTTGPSSVNALAKAAGKGYDLRREDEERMKALYDRPLAAYDRDPDEDRAERAFWRVYLRLVPRQATLTVKAA